MTQRPRRRPEPTPRQPWLHELTICVDGNATALSSTERRHRARHRPGPVRRRRPGPEPAHRRVSTARRRACVAHGRERRPRGVRRLRPQPGQPRRRPDRRGAPHPAAARAAPWPRRSRSPRGPATPVPCAARGRAGRRRGAASAAVKAGHVGHPAAAPELRRRRRSGLPAASGTPAPSRLEPSPGPRSTAPTAGPGGRRARLSSSPGTSASVTLTRHGRRGRRPRRSTPTPARDAVAWDRVRASRRTTRGSPTLFDRRLDDLRHLLLRDPVDRTDVFAAAGTPWYLTLFGRDSHLGRADDAAVRHRAGRRARCAPWPAARAPGRRRGAPRRPARSRTSCAARHTTTRRAAWRCRRSTTARSTPPRSG